MCVDDCEGMASNRKEVASAGVTLHELVDGAPGAAQIEVLGNGALLNFKSDGLEKLVAFGDDEASGCALAETTLEELFAEGVGLVVLDSRGVRYCSHGAVV